MDQDAPLVLPLLTRLLKHEQTKLRDFEDNCVAGHVLWLDRLVLGARAASPKQSAAAVDAFGFDGEEDEEPVVRVLTTTGKKRRRPDEDDGADNARPGRRSTLTAVVVPTGAASQRRPTLGRKPSIAPTTAAKLDSQPGCGQKPAQPVSRLPVAVPVRPAAAVAKVVDSTVPSKAAVQTAANAPPAPPQTPRNCPTLPVRPSTRKLHKKTNPLFLSPAGDAGLASALKRVEKVERIPTPVKKTAAVDTADAIQPADDEPATKASLPPPPPAPLDEATAPAVPASPPTRSIESETGREKAPPSATPSASASASRGVTKRMMKARTPRVGPMAGAAAGAGGKTPRTAMARPREMTSAAKRVLDEWNAVAAARLKEEEAQRRKQAEREEQRRAVREREQRVQAELAEKAALRRQKLQEEVAQKRQLIAEARARSPARSPAGGPRLAALRDQLAPFKSQTERMGGGTPARGRSTGTPGRRARLAAAAGQENVPATTAAVAAQTPDLRPREMTTTPTAMAVAVAAAAMPVSSSESYKNYDISALRSGDETDDEEEPRQRIPAWARGERLKKAIRLQAFASPNAAKAVFGAAPTPDLAQIFVGNPRGTKHARRGSSAHWSLASPRRPLQVLSGAAAALR